MLFWQMHCQRPSMITTMPSASYGKCMAQLVIGAEGASGAPNGNALNGRVQCRAPNNADNQCVNRTKSKGFTPEAWKEGGKCYCACCEFVSKSWGTPLPSWWNFKQQKSTRKKSSSIKHCGDVTVTRKING